jgi:hypothetical protein
LIPYCEQIILVALGVALGFFGQILQQWSSDRQKKRKLAQVLHPEIEVNRLAAEATAEALKTHSRINGVDNLAGPSERIFN